MVCGSWNAKYGKCHKLGVEPWLSDQRQHPWIPTPCWKERPTESQRSGCHHQEESCRKRFCNWIIDNFTLPSKYTTLLHIGSRSHWKWGLSWIPRSIHSVPCPCCTSKAQRRHLRCTEELRCMPSYGITMKWISKTRRIDHKPVVPHKAVAEVSEKEICRRAWLSWIADGRVKRWLELGFWSGCNGCSGHRTHNCWMQCGVLQL